MKWMSLIVLSSFLYGIYKGLTQHPDPDVIFYPFSGFIMGLFVLWLSRAILRNFRTLNPSTWPGVALFWICNVVALVCRAANLRRAVSYKCASPLPE
jgi:hypothetical protein